MRVEPAILAGRSGNSEFRRCFILKVFSCDFLRNKTMLLKFLFGFWPWDFPDSEENRHFPGFGAGLWLHVFGSSDLWLRGAWASPGGVQFVVRRHRKHWVNWLGMSGIRHGFQYFSNRKLSWRWFWLGRKCAANRTPHTKHQKRNP